MYSANNTHALRKSAALSPCGRGLVLLGVCMGPSTPLPPAAALARLVGLGIDGLWLSQQAFAPGMRHLPGPLSPQAAGGPLAAQDPQQALARQAQACGLAVLGDSALAAPGSCVSESGPLLRLQSCSTLWQGEPLAPALHAALACSFKLPAPQALCWMLDDGGLPAASAVRAPRCAQVMLALQLCLKGCHLMDSALAAGASSWLAQFLAWRRQQAALTQGRMRLLPVHDNLLMLERSSPAQKMLCAFNPSERYVRHRLPSAWAGARLLPGSGLDGARLVQSQVDCDPWGALFATLPG